jgi:hypothetical protein
VAATAIREFVEELYGVHELETGDGRVDPNAIYHRREAKLSMACSRPPGRSRGRLLTLG